MARLIPPSVFDELVPLATGDSLLLQPSLLDMVLRDVPQAPL